MKEDFSEQMINAGSSKVQLIVEQKHQETLLNFLDAKWHNE